MAGGAREPGASVARRLLTVLDCFDLTRVELTLTEIATLSHLPVSTTRRLILELTAWGGLERLPNAKYRVGRRLWRLGASAPEQRTLREAALPYMHDLFAATGENVQLAVLDAGEALCVEKLSNDRSVSIISQVGGRTPLHASAVGKVLLAFSPPAVGRELICRRLERVVAHTVVQPGRLNAMLGEVRRTGVAYSIEELTDGVCSVAAPVMGENGQIRAALGIVVPHTTRLDRLAPAVRTAALGISRSLSRAAVDG